MNAGRLKMGLHINTVPPLTQMLTPRPSQGLDVFLQYLPVLLLT